MIIHLVTFIKGGVRVLMSRLLTNFLRHFRICLNQCSLNIFRLLSSVVEHNKMLNLDLTEHDINWVYNCQDSATLGFYFKCHHGEVRLVSSLGFQQGDRGRFSYDHRKLASRRASLPYFLGQTRSVGSQESKKCKYVAFTYCCFYLANLVVLFCN